MNVHLLLLGAALCLCAAALQPRLRRHPTAHDNTLDGLPEGPFSPPDIIQPIGSSGSSTANTDSSQGSPQEGLVQRWWNWLCGTTPEADKPTDRKARKRSRRHRHSAPNVQCPAPLTVTVTETVTVASGAGGMVTKGPAPAQQPRVQQNKSRQADFNDWFDPSKVNRPARPDVEPGEDE